MSDRMRITVLVENTAGRADVGAEHGLAVLIEAGGHRVLFDTGQSDLVVRNAKAMGVTLAPLDAICCSHGHYDHTGGLSAVRIEAPDTPVYLHAAARRERYSIRQGTARRVGMPANVRDVLDERPELIRETDGPVEVAPDLWLTGPIPRRADFEDVGGPFFLDEAGRQPDAIDDDQAIYWIGENGVVLVVGCAHAGVVNTIDFVRELTGDLPLQAVVGGMHLRSASEHRLSRTAEALGRLGDARVAPGHCTGEAATSYLSERLGDRVYPIRCGDVLAFE
jgi:7,8-dihydropterin-6-yl-methyl-4-(beta-D-ribofuranosyl)aminobenzene 5'-phosphate synthase